MNRERIRDILKVAKRLDEKNLVNAYAGNISVKEGNHIYITPTGKNKAFLTEEMIAVMDNNGIQVGGTCKPTSELPMHTEVYKIRDDIGGVVHCHPAFMTAYALCCKQVETKAYPELMANFECFQVAPYGRPGTKEILKGAIPILKHHDIVILGNHGVLAIGTDVYDAMNKVEAAEAITKTIFIAEKLGKTTDLDSDECAYLFSLNQK